VQRELEAVRIRTDAADRDGDLLRADQHEFRRH